MSVEAVRAVMGDRRKGIPGARVKGADLLVLVSFAERASRRNGYEVWSSAADTAWRVNLSTRQVRRCTTRLCAAGLIEQVDTTDQGVPVYRVRWERLLEGADFLSGGDKVSGGDDKQAGGDDTESSGGDPGVRPP